MLLLKIKCCRFRETAPLLSWLPIRRSNISFFIHQDDLNMASSFTIAVTILLAILVSVSGLRAVTRLECAASDVTCFHHKTRSSFGSNATLTDKYGRLAGALTTFAWPGRENVIVQTRKALRDLPLSTVCREALLRISHDTFRQRPWAMKGTIRCCKWPMVACLSQCCWCYLFTVTICSQLSYT